MNYFINNFMKKLRFFELRKNGILKFNFFKNGFSLVELMISLIVISLIAAAFVPVITKKLSSSSIFAGSAGGGFSKTCSNISEDCALCAGDTCLSCKNKCDTGETLNTSDCSCETKIPYYMAVDGLYVTKFNMGDSYKTKIPKEAGVTVVKTGESCGSETDHSAKCCWKGATLGLDCDSSNGDYYGCNRTSCNWAAANAICANYKQDGRTWRLPTSSEMSNWAIHSKGKGNYGLMLCDYYTGYSSAYCDNSIGCPGARNGYCLPNCVWSGSVFDDSNAYHHYLNSGGWYGPINSFSTYAFSVRCVSEIVSNCETFASDGETCTACESGYYLSGKECKKTTEVENCETYSKTENKCETCKNGYELKNGKCEKSPFYMAVDNLYVTKYNMGDNTDTAIPSAAGVTVVNAGATCGSENDYSAKCCWKGKTSSSCNATNGDYSGCNRTVCNFAAATAICANWAKSGKTWRLPTIAEMENWGNNSKSLGSNGLMFCDGSSGYSSAYCDSSNSCNGSYTGNCYADITWSGSFYGSSDAYYYTLYNDKWYKAETSRTSAFSVRCVTEIVPNCKIVSGNTCMACNDGYYLSNGKCIARPTISNCASYSGASCVSCNSGYYLSGGYCYAHSHIANCASMSTTSDTCLSCYSGYTLKNNVCSKSINCTGAFMQVGNVCVTKYNMGDSTDMAIPSSAGVTVVNAGSTCGSSDNYTAKCCWKGKTSGSNCDTTNGVYSGCSRTICNWAAANAICANFVKDGVTWRLPSTSEMSSWLANSKGYGTDGLMLCDQVSGYSSTYCKGSYNCKGAYNNYCYPMYVWSREYVVGASDYKLLYYLKEGSWTKKNGIMTVGMSVRCVTSM